jgi:hypothetical protein
MNEMKFNNVNDDEWGFYIDIENDNSWVADNYSYTDIKHNPTVKAVSDDLSYYINIYNFSEYSHIDNYDYIFDGSENNYNLYNTLCYMLEYYRNKFNTKNVTNTIIKVSSTTFVTVVFSYVLLTIL